MKQLTYSSLAAARLRANKRQYVSLALGIFLSIFLVSTLVLSVYGIYQAELRKRYDRVGCLDMVMLDNAVATEEDLRSFEEVERLGRAYISGIVTGCNVYAGYYDDTGLSLMDLRPVDGRLPETAGEIAVEASAMDVLEVSWNIGETVELDITPVDGIAEKRSFTVVGILPERSVHLSMADNGGLNQFPALLLSVQEPAFATGRVGTHYLMGLAKHSTLDQAIRAVWNKVKKSNGNWNILSCFYGLSITGEQRQIAGLGDGIKADREMYTMAAIAAALGISLTLSCGVGISGAMESVLSQRRDEIGVLRALGATRSQIRRMFGRENLLLAFIVSPLALLASIGGVWLLSLLLPESIALAVDFWLVVPIALFSMTVIVISGHLPLVRASKWMPMRVIRDTAMLRRSKGVKPKKEFSAARLIAARQVRFHPTRQIGASLLLGLTLLCSGLLAGFVFDYANYSIGETAGFRIDSSAGWVYDGHIGIVTGNSMDKRSIAQIRSLPNVKSIRIDRQMTVTVPLEHVPAYAALDGQFDMLDDEQFEAAMLLNEGAREYYEPTRGKDRAEYFHFLKDHGIQGEAYRMPITTVELSPENLNELQKFIQSGKINVDAVNAGKEVLIVAPEVWIKPDENGNGYRYWYSEEAAKKDPAGQGAYLAAWNDSFFAGQWLSLLQLYETEPEGSVCRIDTGAAVGAVLTGGAGLTSVSSNAMILTTEQGLENLGLLAEGLNGIELYLDGAITLREEGVLEQRLNAIARRFEGYTVSNCVEYYRNLEAQNRQKISMLAAITIVFFSASVGMIASALTRQLNSEGRTIGMLRAVGADEKAVLGCYSGQLYASVAGGMSISLVLWLGFTLLCLLEGLELGALFLMGAAICWMGILCLFVCKALLRFRVREIVQEPVIDNIREL